MISQIIIQFLADDVLVVLLLAGAITLVVAVPSSKRWQRYARIIMAGLTALVVAKFMAVLYQPEVARPFEKMGISAGASYLDNPGFPSDHALLAMALMYAVWFCVGKRWLTLCFALGVALVCVGRVLALVHTPLDIAGGLLAATIGALWYIDTDVTRRVRAKKHEARLQKTKT